MITEGWEKAITEIQVAHEKARHIAAEAVRKLSGMEMEREKTVFDAKRLRDRLFNQKYAPNH